MVVMEMMMMMGYDGNDVESFIIESGEERVHDKNQMGKCTMYMKMNEAPDSGAGK
jgi:hypothetical protein